jgi:hypothetical protein
MSMKSGSPKRSDSKRKNETPIGPVPPPPRPLSPPDHFPPGTPDTDAVFERSLKGGSLIASSTLRHVRRVSKRAALATKKQIWDSNDASIVAAQSAVDQWEQGYNGLRGLMLAMGNSAQGLYGAAKAGATGLEHGLLLPVRDWVLLPAFGGVEQIAGETVRFLQSEHAEHFAHQSLHLVRQVPMVGDNILAPALCIGADALKRTWEVAQYPIPSPMQVRNSVDFVMGGTKWALTTAAREVFLYVKRADANITRTLSHTRWKVLGSGPYATLDKLNKREVIDHICERYFSLVDAVARYELAAHVRVHNRPLYHDLVLTGLLRERGGDLTSGDEWLSTCPSYRTLESPFLLEEEEESSSSSDVDVFPLWFRLPYQNGKRPGKETPWVCFDQRERNKLERYYRSVLLKQKENQNTTTTNNGSAPTGAESQGTPEDRDSTTTKDSQKYETNAKWYDPDTDTCIDKDLLLDQKRHAVSFFLCCPKCRQRHDTSTVLPPRLPKQFGELCDSCIERNMEAFWVDTLLCPPPLVAIYRPTMWRFYGPGDELRRATWFLDTQRHGPQPYGEDAQAILEDAYLFLKWTARRRVWDGNILLTVQVPSPDGSEQQLVQFSSLTSATAIGKGLASAIALFKRRVYRGACPTPPPPPSISETETEENTSSSKDGQVKADDHRDETPLEQAPPVEKESEKKTMEGASEDSSSPIVVADKEQTIHPSRAQCWVDLKSEDHQSSRQQSTTGEAQISPDPALHREITSVDAEDYENMDNPVKRPVDVANDDGKCTARSEKHDSGGLEDGHHEQLKRNLSIPVSGPLDDQLLLAFPMDGSSVEGCGVEDDLDDDGSDVDHLVLIVHGIGEMLQAIDFFGLSTLPTIVDCCGFLRKNHEEVLEARFNQLFQTLDGVPQPRKGRVEYLPVEWHESFTIQSQRRLLTSTASHTGNFSINDISLRTIPQLRQFANDTLMDVLYFMSPEHHDIIIDIVVSEMNYIVERFRSLTGFKGDVSLVGHSLGSIITWDILDNQRVPMASSEPSERTTSHQEEPQVKEPSSDSNTETISASNKGEDPDSVSPQQEAPQPYVSQEREDPRQPYCVSQEQEDAFHETTAYPQLSFNVDNAFMLGSPIPVFLMIRNQRKPLSPDFTLVGCSRVFNIFHPYDPVAYRIEPLLDPRNAEIEPKIMTHCKYGRMIVGVKLNC